MPGLVPGIHVFIFGGLRRGWPGQASTSPAMTTGAIRRRLRRRSAEFCLQRRYPRFQRLILLAREPRHVLYCLELLALDEIHVAQEFFGLVAPERIDLALDALGRAGGVVHQPAYFV